MSNKTKHTITQAELNRIIDREREEATHRTLLLVLGYLMEDLNCDEDRICEVFGGVSRYAQAVDDHIISVNKIAEIITEKTGIKVKW